MSAAMKWVALGAAAALLFTAILATAGIYARNTYDPNNDRDVILYKTCVAQGLQWKAVPTPTGGTAWECVR